MNVKTAGASLAWPTALLDLITKMQTKQSKIDDCVDSRTSKCSGICSASGGRPTAWVQFGSPTAQWGLRRSECVLHGLLRGPTVCDTFFPFLFPTPGLLFFEILGKRKAGLNTCCHHRGYKPVLLLPRGTFFFFFFLVVFAFYPTLIPMPLRHPTRRTRFSRLHKVHETSEIRTAV